MKEVFMNTHPSRFAEPLHALDILSDADMKKLTAHIDKANRAQAVYTNHAVTRRNAIFDAAQVAFKATDVETAIDERAVSVPTDAAADVARHVEIVATEAAADIIRRVAGSIPARLTEEFDAIADRVGTLLGKLQGVCTAQQAIEHGVPEVWRELSELRERYETLDHLVSYLGFDGVIPRPKTSDSGWHWSYRIPPETATLNSARAVDPSGLMAWTVTVAQRRYVPSSADEAASILASSVETAA